MTDKTKITILAITVTLIAATAIILVIKRPSKSNDEGYEEIGRAGGASEDPGAGGNNPPMTVDHWSNGKQINAPAEPDHWATQN